ncbi:MAG: hypothetical protein ABIR29_00215 [Chthoniobacterales bacterium]
MQRKPKGQPPRLERIFQKYDAPLFFVTFNTHGRRPLLANTAVHAAFLDYGLRAAAHRVGVGRYVLMPNHVHMFLCLGAGSACTLGEWMKGLKRNLDFSLSAAGERPLTFSGQKLSFFWQPGFFDRLLRSDESYAEKWSYVRENSVRRGLVERAEDWPCAGEIVFIDRV